LHPRHFRGRHHAATILVVLALAVVGFRVFPDRDVTVVEDGRSYRVSATFNPEDEALEALPVSLEPGDRVVEGSGGRYLSLAIQRARPVTISVDGRTMALRTQATTVGGALAEVGVELRAGDRVFADSQLTTARGLLQAAVRYASRTYPIAALDGRLPDLTITVERARPVSVYFDGMRLDTMSAAVTVQDLLADLGVTVREGDLVTPALDAAVTAGSVIQLSTARTVGVVVDGQHQTLYTLANTVADVVNVLGMELGPEDTVSPPLDTPIVPGLDVEIRTVRTVNEVAEEPIQPHIITTYDPEMSEGDTQLVEGVPGLRRVTYALVVRNGVRDSNREIIAQETLREPVPTTRIVGTKPRPGSSKPTIDVAGDGAPTAYSRRLHVRATWYNLDHGAFPPDSPHYGTTASGVKAGWGTCAVDPSVIPLGTRFYVPGYGWCTALDTGALVIGHHIDIFFPNEVGDPGWGEQYIDIYIVD
jgi:uncharacterized protein YabE (DUF348 family)/3D (Asp-Asp-Asp) domain-containing protein